MIKTTNKTPQASAGSVRDSRDQLIQDLKRLIKDAQNLPEDARNATGAALQDKFRAFHDGLGERIDAIRDTGGKIASEAVRHTDNVEELIRKNPWRSVAVAAVLGLVIDRLLPR